MILDTLYSSKFSIITELLALHLGAGTSALICMGRVYVCVFYGFINLCVHMYLWVCTHMCAQVRAEARGQC